MVSVLYIDSNSIKFAFSDTFVGEVGYITKMENHSCLVAHKSTRSQRFYFFKGQAISSNDENNEYKIFNFVQFAEW